MIEAPAFLETAADVLGLARQTTARHWRFLREAGLVPVGKRGRGAQHPRVDSPAAAQLLLSVAAGDNAMAAPEYAAEIARLHAIHPVVCRDTVLAPAGAPLTAAVAALLDVLRAEARDPSATPIFDEADVRLCRARGTLWGELFLRRGHDLPSGFAFIAADQDQRALPLWRPPSGLIRTADIDLDELRALARLLEAPAAAPHDEEIGPPTATGGPDQDGSSHSRANASSPQNTIEDSTPAKKKRQSCPAPHGSSRRPTSTV